MPEWKRELDERLAALDLDPARAVEIVEELSQHLAERHAELLAGGASPEEADRRTRAELREHALVANLARLKQAAATPAVALGAPRRRLLADLVQDVRYGLRTLRRAPGYAAAAAVTLALGVGANSAIFSLVDATVLRRLPVPEPERLVFVRTENAGTTFSYPEYADLRDHQAPFDGLMAWGGITASLGSDGGTDLVQGVIVTGNYFEVLGARPARGRLLSPADDRVPGAHPVAVISHGLWRRRFGARPDIVGHEVLLNGHRFTVVGVTPAAFTGAQLAVPRDLFVPMMMQPVMRPPRAGYSGEQDPDLLRRRTGRWLFLMGRLRPGVSAAEAQAALAPLGPSLAEAARRTDGPVRFLVWPAAGGDPDQRAQLVSVATLLLCVVGAVLLLACANVANLALSRGAARGREIAVRLALGASRGRLVRQLLTESVLLALAGGALGLLLAYGIVAALRASPPPGVTAPQFGIDARVLWFTLSVSVLAGVLFGLAPALGAARAALVPALKDGKAAADPRWRRFDLRGALVVGQVGLSLVLLVAAGLLVRSLGRTQAIDPGFDVERLVAAPLPIDLLRYTRERGVQFYRRLVEDVAALPGVQGAGLARMAVLAGGARVTSLHVEGRAAREGSERGEGLGAPATGRDSVNVNVVDAGYFDTLGIRLRAGRLFGAEDAAASPPVAVVNETFERLHFPEGTERDALHRRISLSGPQGPWAEVVGIVSDSKYRALTEPFVPTAYVPLAQNHESGVVLYVRTSGHPPALVPAVRRAIHALEPNLPVPDVRPLTDTIGHSLYPARMGAVLIGAFGGLALLLSAVGVYGVMAFSVARRTREIGVRMALGAHRRDVLRLVVAEGMRLVAVGAALGLAGALAGARGLEGFLYGVSSRDALTFAAVPAVLAAVALCACLVPARRAARVDPLVALRSE
ncbi:MAG TPA: ABC transporter permease [Vicinamibacteria bacterium]|nr:ABC transporter permease [Vicinamibacteria bacterium]